MSDASVRKPRKRGLTLSRLVGAALLRRKGRVALAMLALAIGATLLTALLTLYRGVQRDLSGEFRRFGANVVVTGTPIAPGLDPAAAAAAARIAGAGNRAVGILFRIARITTPTAQAAGSAPMTIVVVGSDLPTLRRMNPTWLWAGQAPHAANAVWMGVRAAHTLAVRPGSQVAVQENGRIQHWRITGTVESGAAEDGQLFAPLAEVQALAGVTGLTTIELRINGGPAAVHAAVAALRAALPDTIVTPVRPIAASEGEILLRTRGLLIASTALILLTLGLGLAAALASAALERRFDFGLMRALGASTSHVFGVFAAEALILGIAAAVIGFGAGSALAAAIGRAVFGTTLPPRAGLFALTLVATVLLAGLAALAPWPVVRRAAPATILKGE